MATVSVFLTEADFRKYLDGERVEGMFIAMDKNMAVEIQLPVEEVTVHENRGFLGGRLIAVLNDK